MKYVAVIGFALAALCLGCSGQKLADDMHKLKMGEKMDVGGARVHFKLNKSGDSLYVHIHKSWAKIPTEKVTYEVKLYDAQKGLIQTRTHRSQPRFKTMNTSLNFSMVDENNLERVTYFSVSIAE
jgi:hypothetical protein